MNDPKHRKFIFPTADRIGEVWIDQWGDGQFSVVTFDGAAWANNPVDLSAKELRRLGAKLIRIANGKEQATHERS